MAVKKPVKYYRITFTYERDGKEREGLTAVQTNLKSFSKVDALKYLKVMGVDDAKRIVNIEEIKKEKKLKQTED